MDKKSNNSVWNGEVAVLALQGILWRNDWRDEPLTVLKAVVDCADVTWGRVFHSHRALSGDRKSSVADGWKAGGAKTMMDVDEAERRRQPCHCVSYMAVFVPSCWLNGWINYWCVKPWNFELFFGETTFVVAGKLLKCTCYCQPIVISFAVRW